MRECLARAVIPETMRYDAETGEMIELAGRDVPTSAYMPLPETIHEPAFGVRRLLDQRLASTLRLALRELQEHHKEFPEEMKFPKTPGVLLLPTAIIGKHKEPRTLEPIKGLLETQCRSTIEREPEAEIIDLRVDGTHLNLLVSAPELSSETAAIREVLKWHNIHGLQSPKKEKLVTTSPTVVSREPRTRELFAITLGRTKRIHKLTARKRMELIALQTLDDIHGVENLVPLQRWDYIEPQNPGAVANVQAA